MIIIIICQVYDRLNSIGISIAYTTVTKLIESLGEHHNTTVRKWRDDIISRLTFNDVRKLNCIYVDTLHC